jgi:hypothetical protein
MRLGPIAVPAAVLVVAALGILSPDGAAGPARAKLAPPPAPTEECRIEPVAFEGWQAQQITNRWLKLVIVPQLGGRLMQATFAGHAFLFVNAKYRGQHIPPSEDTHRWINYGGDKIWPMPEGSEDDRHWPGPYSGVLDDGEYSFRDVSRSGRCAARLEGPADARTGLQYSREISVDAASPEISFRAEMKNVSGHPVRWSVQSVTQYDTADARDSAKWNRDFWAFAPANPASAYLDGYHVRSGLAEDPSFSVKQGTFTLRWLNLQSEVWVDSPGGWVAAVDGVSRFAMIERFDFDAKAEYPAKASVIFYKNGPAVEVNSEGVAEVRTSTEDAPFYMEAELNSPMVSLAPGESYAFHTLWQPTRAGAEFKTVTDAGVVLAPLAATSTGEKVKLDGKFGVLFEGKLVARLSGANRDLVLEIPLRAADPAEEISLQAEIAAPDSTQSVSVHMIDAAGRDRGSLGEAPIVRAGGSD